MCEENHLYSKIENIEVQYKHTVIWPFSGLWDIYTDSTYSSRICFEPNRHAGHTNRQRQKLRQLLKDSEGRLIVCDAGETSGCP